MHSVAKPTPNPALNDTLAGLPSPTRYANGGPRPTPGTINALFFDAVARYARPDALSHKVRGVWTPVSHATVLQRVRHVAYGLAELGVVPQDRRQHLVGKSTRSGSSPTTRACCRR